MKKKALFVALAVGLTGCGGFLSNYSKRSELEVTAVANNAVTEGKERGVNSRLHLRGSNRDILNAYKDSMAFILEKVAGVK